MSVGESADVNMPTQELSDTAPVARKTTTIGSSRKAAFYDKHLASHLTLERVVYLEELVSIMAGTVDQAIKAAIAKQPLPKDSGILLSAKVIERQVRSTDWIKYHKSGLAESYIKHTATYCLLIASTLAIHPSSMEWDQLLVWTVDGRIGWWAIADGVLRLSPNVLQDDGPAQQLLKNEHDRKKALLKKLTCQSTTLAVWEMKNLTLSNAQVMNEILEMGLSQSKFPWKTCTARVCVHMPLECMAESTKSYDRGVDSRSLPWTLPTDPIRPASSSRPTLWATPTT